jgi:hypothetical protein
MERSTSEGALAISFQSFHETLFRYDQPFYVEKSIYPYCKQAQISTGAVMLG